MKFKKVIKEVRRIPDIPYDTLDKYSNDNVVNIKTFRTPKEDIRWEKHRPNRERRLKIEKDLQTKRDRVESKKRDLGEMFIEFAIVEIKEKIYTPIIVKTKGEIGSIFKSGKTQYKSLPEFEDDLRRNFAKNYGMEKDVPRKVKEQRMADIVYKNMIDSIRQRANDSDNKNKSLSYNPEEALPGEKNVSWDMHIKFRLNIDTNLIEPQIEHGTQKYGKIIGADEIEQKDDSLKDLFKS